MKLKHAVVFATALGLAPISAFAAKKAAPAAPKPVIPTLDAVLGASGINVSGTVDVSYDWLGTGAPNAGTRAFDPDVSSFVFHQLNLTISKQWSNGLSLVVNPIFGEDAAAVAGNAGRGANPTALAQAYLSYTMGDVTLMGGQMLTLAGSEVINPAGNINASRGFLFIVLQPLTHTGVRASYAICKGLTATAGLMNGGNSGAINNINNNTNLSYEGQLAYTGGLFSAAATMYHGEENTPAAGAAFSGNQTNTLYDIVVSVTPVDMLTLGLNADFVKNEAAAFPPTTHVAHWGMAAYANVKLTPKARIALRGEYLSFDNSAVANPYNHFNSLTGTFGYSPLSGLELIAEARFNGASDPASFPNADATQNYQQGGTLKAIYKF